MKKLFRRFFGEYCSAHNQSFRSDFCPQCMKARYYKQQTHDGRKEWVKSEGVWPIKGKST